MVAATSPTRTGLSARSASTGDPESPDCTAKSVVNILRQLPRIKIPATRVLSYPFRALVLARLPKSSGGDDERTEGTAHGHHQERGPEIDRDQEKGVSSPSGFRLPQRQCSASRNRV